MLAKRSGSHERRSIRSAAIKEHQLLLFYLRVVPGFSISTRPTLWCRHKDALKQIKESSPRQNAKAWNLLDLQQQNEESLCKSSSASDLSQQGRRNADCPVFVMLPLGTVLGMRHDEVFVCDAQKGQEEALALALDKLASAKVKV